MARRVVSCSVLSTKCLVIVCGCISVLLMTVRVVVCAGGSFACLRLLVVIVAVKC